VNDVFFEEAAGLWEAITCIRAIAIIVLYAIWFAGPDNYRNFVEQ
jgi:hypothetical protein